MSHDGFSVVGPEEVRRVQRDGEWYQKNYVSLCAEHAGQFIAIFDREVLAESESRNELLSKLEGQAGVDPQRALVEYVPKPQESLQMMRHVTGPR